ncbi:MAG: glycoside hydrolase family 78 protein [Prevotella sp.]|jgi:alpha-L-rhamnosidase|nr:alpha-L-rhamnosidase [Prevotella sp.]MCH3969536.1 glycoside hydrolase family 78 protein [Prevotella sp.]MCH3992888.1 glycoside hydrolase family 78 protein [Prevotella sp.]MCH4186206.1 glycoside hydrolase family 78 protein [Prevotella sp.]MCH4216243.1 glycoside hydrolase family 78 protein [Prevotella sp.]MCH4251275.1 glycoside hydrolase family 78 protein [Prevotella sp.]
MRHKYFLILLLTMIGSTFCTSLKAKSRMEITDLLTNYETTPYGVEGKPVFSWKMDVGRGYKSLQKAYRVLVGESPEDLQNGIYVYDSGKITSGLSVSIPYNGRALQPCTRYFWKVIVWDQKGHPCDSRPVWFETSLMNSGWDGAQWIGSGRPLLSKYLSNCILDYEVQIARHSHSSVFVFGCRDSLNYVGAQLALGKNGIPFFAFLQTENGVEKETGQTDLSSLLPSSSFYGSHHVRLILDSDGCYYYRIWVEIDGKKVRASEKEEAFRLYFKNWGQLCRLFAIGFRQPEGEDAVFSHLQIREKARGTVLYDDPKVYTLTGDGKLNTWYPGAEISAPMLRKTFSLSGRVKSARLYATARGIYEMYLNGRPVAEDFLNPGWTDYRFRIMYNTYDVTSLLQNGENALGAILGNGWWSDYCGYNPEWMDQYGVEQSLLAKLVITYEDGKTQTIVSDGSWQSTSKGPITANSLYNGEDIDARKEMPGWSTAGFSSLGWEPATVFEAPSQKVRMQPYTGQPVRVDTVCAAHSMTEPLPHTYIYDMGQNMVGIPRILLKGKAGDRITVKYGEMTYPEVIPVDPVPPYTIEDYKKLKGQLYTDNYRSALSTDHYICKGSPDGEVFEPHFTTHGFRYIQITGLSEPLDKEDVKVLVLNSLPGRQESSYHTSDRLINKLYSNIQWGERGNFLSVPTDCPQRDERLGWMGDAQIFSRTASYNRNVNPFFTRWFYTVRDNQGDDGNFSDFAPVVGTSPQGGDKGGSCFGWADAGIIIPWQVYQQYDDTRFLEDQYDSMQKYMQYAEKHAKDYIEPIGGYGDWVAPLGTQSDLTNTCYFAYDAQLMSKMAGILGKTADSLRYQQLFGQIKEAFNKRFVDNEGYMLSPVGSPLFTDSYSTAFGTGPRTKIQRRLFTETAYIMPLEMNLLEGEVKQKALIHLSNVIAGNHYCLNTGFIGTPYLNLVLSQNGCDSIAYKLFQQTAYPSWLYPVLQGATTIWERWNSYTIKNGFGPVGMNSFNHYSYGAVQEWMMEYSAGIQRDDDHPAYKHFYLQPRVGGRFNYIHASYNSMYGRIGSAWDSNNHNPDIDDASKYGYTYTAEVPANTTATLLLEMPDHAKLKIIRGRKGILGRQKNGHGFQFELGSGKYQFKVMNERK